MKMAFDKKSACEFCHCFNYINTVGALPSSCRNLLTCFLNFAVYSTFYRLIHVLTYSFTLPNNMHVFVGGCISRTGGDVFWSAICFIPGAILSFYSTF